MHSISEERAGLGRDRIAFSTREAQLGAFIRGLGLKVPPPAPGSATATFATSGASAPPSPPVSARGAAPPTASSTSNGLAAAAARAGGAPSYLPVNFISMLQRQTVAADAAAAASH